jgi:CRP/FNR family transcriptional regulator, cyclic AMP receptor protein
MMLWDLLGYAAAILVLTTFYMRDMVPLRVTALCSNLAFIAYSLALGLIPICLLHVLLLPMNGYRLLQELRVRARSRAALSSEPASSVQRPSGAWRRE